MNNLNFRETLSVANSIYKKAFKVTFILAFILSFISEYSTAYLMNHGLYEYVQSGGKNVESLPPGGVLIGIFIIIIFSTIFVYGMIALVQGLLTKENELKAFDSVKISLQIFSKRAFPFIGAFLLSMILLTLLSAFLQYLGIYIATLVFLTVLPAVILGNESVFQSILNNFNAIRSNLFYMLSLAFIIFALILVKPILTYGFLYLLQNMEFSNSLGVSVQNILITIIDSFVIPYMFAISVATYLTIKNKPL